MLNRADRDLDSATVRTRFFGGRSAAAVATEMPILPVTAPGLPPPGPSFVVFSQLLGDDPPPPPPPGRRRPATRPDGPYLTALVRSALYQMGTAVRVPGASGNHDDPEAGVVALQPGVLATNDPGGDRYGPGRCRLMVVGKCLGPTEVQAGRPFHGPGSRPLWEAWAEAGLPPPGPDFPVFLTNLVPFAPPLNAISRIPKDWVADGLHLLYQQVAVCRPEVVLVLGADALKALFGPKARVVDYRGRLAQLAVDCRPVADAPPDVHTAHVVATDHPAAVARDPGQHPALVAGLRAAAVALGFADQEAQVPLDHQPVYTTAELHQAVAESVKASAAGGYVAFDCEWEGRHPSDPGAYLYTVQWSHAPGHARCVFLRRCGGGENAALPVAEAVPLLRRLFEGAPARGARLVGHFAKADLPWLASIGVDLYPHFVGPADDPDPDGVTRLYAHQKCYFEGAFDSYVGVHAVDESAANKLEIVAATLCGMDRWDTDMAAWRAEFCKSQKISQAALRGYGNCPEWRILPYACHDPDGTGRIYLKLNGDPRTGTPGLLDRDRYGNSCRRAFAMRMRAWAAWAEMERYGLGVDLDRRAELRAELAAKREELIDRLRAEANWHDVRDADGRVVHEAFDPGKRRHRVEFLFGEQYLDCPSVRPPGALSLGLDPYMSTAKTDGRLWADAVANYNRRGGDQPVPAANQETMIHRAREHRLAELLKQIDFLGTAMKILFRQPKDADDDDDDDGSTVTARGPVAHGGVDDLAAEVHERGLLAVLAGDGRVRSVFGFVETGRSRSGGGLNLQNVSGSRDEQLDAVLGWGKAAPKGSPLAERNFVSRSIFVPRPGWWYVDADLKGAEIMMAAWLSGDPVLMEHARRNNLPESDPDWLDLHADLANTAFNLNLPLKEVKKQHPALRVAAKRTRFGHYYGASPGTILRQVLEESPHVTLAQIEAIVAGHDRTYPVLTEFFAAVRQRPARPGWMANGFGGMRRFRYGSTRDLQEAQGREAQNWTCQAGVADAVNTGLGHLWADLRRRRMEARIVLSVHDSFLIECPRHEVVTVVDDLLPLNLSERTPVVPTDLSGNPLARGPYRFGLKIEVGRRWGVPLPDAEWRAAVAAA